jgi:two-component system response regulator NreC
MGNFTDVSGEGIRGIYQLTIYSQKCLSSARKTRPRMSETQSKYHILLVDDYPAVRRVVKEIIETSPELQVIGEVSDGLELLRFLKKSLPEMVLLDITMPHLNGLEATRRVKKDYPGVKILIVTIQDCKQYMQRSMSMGAEGYLLKDDVVDELLLAITSLRQGKTYISPRLLS